MIKKAGIVQKSAISVFAVLIYIATIFIALPYIPEINAYDAYGLDPGTIDEPAFPEPVVPCLKEDLKGQKGSVLKNPEFHSLRPYQASPCGDAPKAFFCNNNYTIIEDVSQAYDPSLCWFGSIDGSGTTGSGTPGNVTANGTYYCRLEPNATKCTVPNPGGGQVCSRTYIIGGEGGRDYAVSLNKVKYPFVGNTQNVINSQNPEDEFGAAQKMNEYVNWYIQGVAEKAEYGDLPGSVVEQYAGPTKKLVPLDILNFARLNVLHDGVVREWTGVGQFEYQGDLSLLVTDPVTGDSQIKETQAHNQITVCTDDIYGLKVAVPCYKGDGSKAQGSPRRYDKWFEARGSLPWERYDFSEGNRFKLWNDLSVWGGMTPPFPWLFNNELYYIKAYHEWRGESCGIVNGSLFCVLIAIPNPLDPLHPFSGYSAQTEYSYNYKFIALGNAGDKNGGHAVSGVQVHAAGQTIFDLLGYVIFKVPVLHYGQTESTVQVSNLLNQVHTPLNCEVAPDTEEDAGVGVMCCPAGRTFNAITGSCILDNVKKVCDGFASDLCDGLIGNILNLPQSCNDDVSNACQGYVVGADFAANDTQAMCQSVSDISGLSLFGTLPVNICKTLVGFVFSSFQNSDISAETACTGGLVCGTQGICTNPGLANGLSCNKITGIGSKYEPESCEFTEVRTNPGDSLTFQDPKSYLRINNVEIEVETIECSNPGEIKTFIDVCGGVTWNKCLTDACDQSCTNLGLICPPKPGIPASCTNKPKCKAEINVEIPSTPKIPYVNQLWKETVVGKNSAFRTIFPKMEEGAPVQCIKEIPGSSPVTYMTNSVTNLTKVETAGPNTYPAGGASSQSEGQLFFPHLGTIYEYFLKGIQTALRPRGLGAGPIPQGENCKICGELPVLPQATGACKLANASVDATGSVIPNTFAQILEAAGQTYHVPPQLIVGLFYGEGVFNGGTYKGSGEAWSEANAINWASCTPLPNCTDPASSIVGYFNETGYEKVASQILPDLQKLDPKKKEVDPCNLLDATYLWAKSIHDSAGGSPSMTGKTCMGIPFTSTNPQDCAWDPSQYETAIRVWEFGTCYGPNCGNPLNAGVPNKDGLLTCATEKNSRLLGGGFKAQCSTDTIDNYDTCPPDDSHNSAVWDVAHGK